MKRISIIIPTLNEASDIEPVLRALAPLRLRGHQVIVADGGSNDQTAALARPLADKVLIGARGRSNQMNAGARIANGDVLLFVHADTRLPEEADKLILDGLETSRLAWGRFDVRIQGRHPMLKIIAWFMNRRSRLTSVCTGDQAVFVKRDLFMDIGGYPPIALMEDIALSRSLLRASKPLCVRERATTSGRRWESGGICRTMVQMWWLRLRYFFGASPSRLARAYNDVRR